MTTIREVTESYLDEKKALDFVREWLAEGIYVEPHGKNGGIIDEKFNRGKKDGAPWCNTMLFHAFEEAGHPWSTREADWWRWRSVETFFHHLEALDKIVPPGKYTTPDEGDLVIFNSRHLSDKGGGWHIAICHKVLGDKHFRTIDGNWGNKMAMVTRSILDRSIVGYATLEGAA